MRRLRRHIRWNGHDPHDVAGVNVPVRIDVQGARMTSATDLPVLLPAVIDIARRAAGAILEVYEGDFAVEHKDDRSPLTAADQAARAVDHRRRVGAGQHAQRARQHVVLQAQQPAVTAVEIAAARSA
jgi:hypothetical protein